ncbi:hypothetical protein COT97_01400 [Candidatus Falkowbacteria bacterium CG10_big_fil_rev_8_21_14_0_10_39_11]|uniref:Uncharacterized protein n=1 Tax=Candidatus Falkowbacteria bacterium CG10_big_fil_rev_8_21_14_0_10_39_11 TaxID=1974565 RepID=A0A2H0V7U8_9BACT|nr:MAG: hypothetical protein COT97_01400 [Candidatus Falkowbacteria bacterium CG10_big_fil_rev_8_21_14_0_10_39_11]
MRCPECQANDSLRVNTVVAIGSAYLLLCVNCWVFFKASEPGVTNLDLWQPRVENLRVHDNLTKAFCSKLTDEMKTHMRDEMPTPEDFIASRN